MPYRHDRLVALFPDDHPLAGESLIAFAQLRGSDHISQETGSSLQILLARAAEAQGFALATRIEVTTFEAAMRMVEAGLGVAVMPEGVLRACVGNLRVTGVPLSDDWARRSLVICVKDPTRLTGAARLMLAHLRGLDETRKVTSPG